MRFTDRTIRNLKPDPGKPYDINEGNGFVIRVNPTGKKVFYYVFKMNGKIKRVRIGEYGDAPLMPLIDARSKHAELLKDRKSGSDPTLRARKEKKGTINQLCHEYIEYYAKRKKKSWEKDQRALELDVLPVIGNRTAKSIRRSDIVALLEKMKARGVERQVNIVHTILSKAFTFALQRDFPGLEFNPCRDIEKIGIENERDRILSKDEIRALWSALDNSSRMGDTTKRALKLILITAQRPGECLNMERDEISGEWWTIPAAKHKTSIDHRVYLTETARKLIKKKGRPFPKGEHRLLSHAVRRLCTQFEWEPFTPHDLRRTAATLMAENGVTADHVDRVLSHKMGKIRRTYNRHTYDEEKKRALLVLESSVLKILNEK